MISIRFFEWIKIWMIRYVRGRGGGLNGGVTIWRIPFSSFVFYYFLFCYSPNSAVGVHTHVVCYRLHWFMQRCRFSCDMYGPLMITLLCSISDDNRNTLKSLESRWSNIGGWEGGNGRIVQVGVPITRGNPNLWERPSLVEIFIKFTSCAVRILPLSILDKF